MNEYENANRNEGTLSAGREDVVPARVPMPWERRLGLILSSYFFGYATLLTFEKNPDGNGVFVGLAVTAGFLVAALPSTIRNRKA